MEIIKYINTHPLLFLIIIIILLFVLYKTYMLCSYETFTVEIKYVHKYYRMIK